MKIVPCSQGSVEWLEKRAGIPTTSEFAQLVTPKFEARTGEMPRSYLSRKLAEAWCGPLPGFGSWATEQGGIREGEGLPFLEFQFGWNLEHVGLCTDDAGRIGCSPDALASDFGVELKCPEAPTHISYLLAGSLPDAYAAQVYGGMLVTGLPQWKFVSYRRHLPPLIVTVNRDEQILLKLQEALDVFLKKFDVGMARLIELNGGNGPPKRVPMVFASDVREEFADIIP